THPEIVRQIVKLVKAAGATPIIGDSPGGTSFHDIKLLWEKTGMARVARGENVELVNFEAAGSFEINLDNKFVKAFRFSNVVKNVDGIINMPKLKTHSLMYLTAAVKNFYGIIPGLIKTEYHKFAPRPDDFATVLADIYAYIKPKVRLNVLDAVVSMDGQGPSGGNLKNTGFIAASSDAVSIDSAAMKMLKGDQRQNKLISILHHRELGETDISKIETMGDFCDNLESFEFPELGPPVELPDGVLPKGGAKASFNFPSVKIFNRVPNFLANFMGKFLWVKPVIKPAECVSCMLCLKSCPVDAIKVSESTKKPYVINKKCISCYCCHEFCQYKAMDFSYSLLAGILLKKKKK
ncbi:MAG: DUF362 domain-containing protein, partial [Elusimicrobia bacterium]|nr:DUF362 domain-containing protein [Elusimicrobiota bacterium]